ncbi:energy transducer TonB [Litorimonas sp.]|uniref:energy transducer TonB n=1 Tax=Litorimonas sp. TaxID=1892381 RepID=UPI003A886EEA
MYQDIDDIDAEDGQEAGSSPPVWRRPKGLIALTGLGLLALMLVLSIFFREQAPTPAKPDLSQTEAATKAYLTAISEQDPALRRARLSDYLLTFENGPHETAVLAQIDVINRYEGGDWEQVQLTAYNPRLSKDVKLGVLKRYEEKWGGSLLGSREDDIERLRVEIMDSQAPTILPDRSLEGQNSGISETVPDNFLAGGPGFADPDFSNRPEGTFPSLNQQAEVIPLRVRRDRRPIYPRSAERRGIGGVVTLLLNVDAEGRVVMTEVASVEADRYERDFIRAAQRAAMRTRYYPRTENGRAVPVSGISKTYRFRAE